MANSEGNSSNAKTNSGNFVWSDNEVELLLNVVLIGIQNGTNGAEYVTGRHVKHTDIVDLFPAPKSLFFCDTSCRAVL